MRAVYLVFIAVAAVGAALFMDDLGNQKSDLRAMAKALKFCKNWVTAFLYIGTFGSFIGFSFAFGQVLQVDFLAGGGAPAAAALPPRRNLLLIGTLLRFISRPIGGELADRIGGGGYHVHLVAMTFAAGILVARGERRRHGRRSHGRKMVATSSAHRLFLLAGIGNGRRTR